MQRKGKHSLSTLCGVAHGAHSMFIIWECVSSVFCVCGVVLNKLELIMGYKCISLCIYSPSMYTLKFCGAYVCQQIAKMSQNTVHANARIFLRNVNELMMKSYMQKSILSCICLHYGQVIVFVEDPAFRIPFHLRH